MHSLNLSNVGFQYSNHGFSLKGIDLQIPPKKIVALLGRSGCGKSTLLRMISGIQEVHYGDIYIYGQHVCGANTFVKPEKRNIGMIFQNPSLFPHKNVLDNIKFAIPKNSSDDFAIEYLQNVGMSQYAKFFPHMLSGGQQQLIAIARALANQSQLLLMDEPFANIDSSLRPSIIKKTIEAIRKNSLTAIIVTHDPAEAFEIADIVCVMEAGKLIQNGEARDVYNNPVSYPVAKLFSRINRIEGIVKNGYFISEWGKIYLKNYSDDCWFYVQPEFFILNDNVGITAIVKKVNYCSQMIQITTENGNTYDIRTLGGYSLDVGDSVRVLLNLSKIQVLKS